jgi:hypothetical protein
MQGIGFPDATVVVITLLILLGTAAYYLYHRIDMLERKIGLMENILLDLKVATEQSLLASAEPSEHDSGPRLTMPTYQESSSESDSEPLNVREMLIEPVPRGPPTPKLVEVTREDVHKNPVTVNYEAMTYKELTALAKQRGLSGLRNASKATVIDALRRHDAGEAPATSGSDTVSISSGAPGRTLDISSWMKDATPLADQSGLGSADALSGELGTSLEEGEIETSLVQEN